MLVAVVDPVILEAMADWAVAVALLALTVLAVVELVERFRAVLAELVEPRVGTVEQIPVVVGAGDLGVLAMVVEQVDLGLLLLLILSLTVQ
jgi:hypothetical protein